MNNSLKDFYKKQFLQLVEDEEAKRVALRELQAESNKKNPFTGYKGGRGPDRTKHDGSAGSGISKYRVGIGGGNY